MLGLVYGLS